MLGFTTRIRERIQSFSCNFVEPSPRKINGRNQIVIVDVDNMKMKSTVYLNQSIFGKSLFICYS